MSEEFVVIPGYEDAAGAIVWWDLTGEVDLMEMEDAWLDKGGAEALLPAIPSVEVCAKRAADSAVSTKRELVRQIRRGAWDFLKESVVGDDVENEHLEHSVAVRIRIVKDTDDGEKRPQITAAGEQWDILRDEIARQYNHYRGSLIASDISSWLLWMLNKEILAVSLRQRGGFYFIPADQIPAWKMISETIRSVSSHQMYEIPAMRAEDTVAAVLTAVRKEAEATMQEMEDYLMGDVSTKGLNAIDRKTADVQAKVAKYAELLGVALPDLQERATTLLGSCQAARMLAAAEDAQ
jgi:hypothetical protein